jgi:hypothetical protein
VQREVRAMSRHVWVPLKAVVQLALYGEPISPDASDEEKLRAKPGILRGLPSLEQFKRREQFDIALSKAALDGRVHFEGCRSPNAPPESISLTSDLLT